MINPVQVGVEMIHLIWNVEVLVEWILGWGLFSNTWGDGFCPIGRTKSMTTELSWNWAVQ